MRYDEGRRRVMAVAWKQCGPVRLRGFARVEAKPSEAATMEMAWALVHGQVDHAQVRSNHRRFELPPSDRRWRTITQWYARRIGDELTADEVAKLDLAFDDEIMADLGQLPAVSSREEH